MATVCSLICFGGRLGKSATMTIANPCVVTLTNHGLRAGAGVSFSTTGALPTGITAGTTYYAKSTASNTFNLYDTAAHAITGGTTGRVTTTGSQSGAHTITGAYYNALTSDQKLRYGAAGSELIYDGLAAWRSVRYSAAQPYDTEICEIGEAWDDVLTATLTLNIPAAETIIWPKVNGVWSAGWHGGVLGAGYRAWPTSGYAVGLLLSGVRQKLIGFEVYTTTNNIEQIKVMGVFNRVDGMIACGPGNNVGFLFETAGTQAFNCIATGGAGTLGTGFKFNGYSNTACIYANNLAAKCTTGFIGSASSCSGWYYNNISVGNTTNWGTAPTVAGGAVCAYNGGVSGNTPWYTTTDTGIKTLTADNTTFVDYTGNNFKPASSSAAQVDSGIVVLDMTAQDMLLDLRPNYNNGGAEAWDIGPFEFDHGYARPLTITVAFPGVPSGSEIRAYKVADGAEVFGVESCDADHEFTLTYTTDTLVRIVIVNFAYKIKEFTYTIISGNQSLPIQQEADKWYSNPA